jgi:hypothetical protein
VASNEKYSIVIINDELNSSFTKEAIKGKGIPVTGREGP